MKSILSPATRCALQGLVRIFGRGLPIAEICAADAGGPKFVSAQAEAGFGAPFPSADCAPHAALARALPRDPLHLARTGVALRSIAREANLYPATLPSMAPGIAATARRPEDVRMFSGPGPEQGRMPRRRWRPPDAMTVAIGVGAVVVAGVIGIGVAALAISLLDPVTANSTTALVAGGIIGALLGAVIALRVLRRVG